MGAVVGKTQRTQGFPLPQHGLCSCPVIPCPRLSGTVFCQCLGEEVHKRCQPQGWHLSQAHAPPHARLSGPELPTLHIGWQTIPKPRKSLLPSGFPGNQHTSQNMTVPLSPSALSTNVWFCFVSLDPTNPLSSPPRLDPAHENLGLYI